MQGLLWLADHRNDVALLAVLVVASLNVYLFIEQRRLNLSLKRLFLCLRGQAFGRYPVSLRVH